ncbi:unnamed protein product [Symbiodinium natans]|uniref:Steroid 5-alpha reductase C-terminal domain-containing protein n=1 Tax=Symbiodinium natans TaxID=878477 RepID=A0A812TTA2_9DINO|nr:unnamed protein product [Symbiodinium natans]
MIGRPAALVALGRVPGLPALRMGTPMSSLGSLGQVAAVDVSVQFACFAVAAALQTEKFYDISASLTYVLCVLLSFRAGGRSTRCKVNSGLVIAWAVRLGSFLLWRVVQDGGDSRFEKVKTQPRKFFVFWAVQALWILLTALPVYLSNGKPSVTEEALEEGYNTRRQQREERDGVSWRDVLGWSLWGVGFATQVVADVQKRVFQADPRNRGLWIQTGLWKLSQHPNYFGEICMWWGIFLSCSTTLRGWELLSIVPALQD